ncbi:MAG: hypothetical protein FWG72_10310 [Oscillospiraceae bacterium]|nr:hypothetical protein [Oscillospiraceae bacterium]
MNWARAKTLLIVLLLLANLLLGGILLYREGQMRAIEARAMDDLCALLAQNGLTAEPGQIPAAVELTYDAERAPEDETPGPHTVRGLPVWGVVASQRAFAPVTPAPVTGSWLWDEALPINPRPGFSAGYALLQLTDGWDRAGVLQSCELGFTATPIAPGAMRLRPCWRFVISGEVFYIPAV